MNWLRRLLSCLRGPELPTKLQTNELMTLLKRQEADLKEIAAILVRRRG